MLDPAATGLPAHIAGKLSEWNHTIATVRGQFEHVLLQSLKHSEPIIAAIQGDVAPLDRIWGPMEGELERAQHALSDCWRRTSASLAREESLTWQVLSGEENRLAMELVELSLALTAAHRQVKARAAQAMLQHALRDDARSRYCGGCGSPLVNTLVGQSQNYSCTSCGFSQCLEPGPAFRSFAVAAARWVGEWDAFGHWQAMCRAEAQIETYRDSRDVPMDLLHYFNAAAENYWRTCLAVEAHLVPEMAKHVPAKLDASMRPARKVLRSHWQWRAFEEG